MTQANTPPRKPGWFKGGKVIAIAQTRPKRSAAYPNVPTLAEEGLPGFDATTWYGLVGPPKMPPAMLARMNEDVNTVLAMHDVKERLGATGAEDSGGSAQRFAEFMRSERDKYTKLVKAAGIKADS